MAWLWSSWKEYVDYVQPVALRAQNLFRITASSSWFETQQRLTEAVRELSDALSSLRALGYEEDSDAPLPSSEANEVYALVAHLVRAGEELLLYHKRLALSDASYGFLHQHEILEEWERYSGTKGLYREIEQLVKDTDELLSGYRRMVAVDENFLVSDLKMPPELKADFILARNLFSVGFDEVGVLIAGRGLEGVLRKTADIRKIMIVVKGSPEPASEASFNDLIEVMSRLRWKVKKSLLITSDTKALLHYLRVLRNGGAHPNIQGRTSFASHREAAAIVAETANRLWKEIIGTRTVLNQTAIQKMWP
jgi:hypothetical protein